MGSYLLPFLIIICIFVLLLLIYISANIIIIVIFVIIIIILLVLYFSKDTTTLSHLKSAKDQSVIKKKDINDADGSTSTQYGYSIWFYVDQWETNFGKEKILLQRANKGGKSGGQHEVFNPKISLGDTENNIIVTINSDSKKGHNSPSTKCEIKNFPIQSWVNVILSLDTRTLDLYLDGKLVRTCILPGIAKEANGDIVVTPHGSGFSGWTSNVKFYNHSLNPQQAYNIYKKGAGSASLGGIFDKYKLKFSYLVNNIEEGSVEI